MFAETCVFDKQSQKPIYCDREQREPPTVPLIANLRGHFAEFLNHYSPERLRLLVSPTCVSFSTVIPLQRIEDFLGRVADDFSNINAIESKRRLMGADFPIPRLEVLYDHF